MMVIASRAIASVFGFPLEHLGNPIILIVTAEISIRFAGPHPSFLRKQESSLGGLVGGFPLSTR